MSDWLVALDLGALKGVAAMLLLPPFPLLLLALVGALWLPRHRWRGWACLGLALAGIWLTSTAALGELLMRSLVPSPPALTAADIQRLRGAPHTAILVLGAGRRQLALEYGAASLKPFTLARLQYGLWLARRTGLPVGYSGGLWHGVKHGAPGQPDEPTEAEVAGRVAAQDFKQPLRWLEDRARDTRENASFSVPLLHADGITRIVLVTHGFHQRRALRNFERALRETGLVMDIVPAPLGLQPPASFDRLADWLPTAERFSDTRLALHEWLGWLAGA